MPDQPFQELAFSAYYELIAAEFRDSIERYNNEWENVLWSRRQDDELYAPVVEQLRLPIFILSCTLLECAINFYLCTKCDAEEFKRIDKVSLFEKWTEGPSKFNPSYEVEPELAADLGELIERRKAIVHPKPMISIDGDNRHKGNDPSFKTNEHDFVGRCARLPLRLVDNVSRHGNDFIFLSSLRIQCVTVANEFEKGVNRQKLLFSFPRELIEELMEQGFDRRTAVRYAIHLRKEPPLDETGHYTIYPGKKIQIKPLKYFESKKGAS